MANHFNRKKAKMKILQLNARKRVGPEFFDGTARTSAWAISVLCIDSIEENYFDICSTSGAP